MKQNILAVTGKPLPVKFFSSSRLGAGKKWFYSLLLALFFVPALYAQSPSGTHLEREWLKQFTVESSIGLAAHTIKIGPDHMPVMVGSSRGTNSKNRIVTIKSDNSGAVVWQRVFEGESGSYSHTPFDVKMDKDGNIYILAMLELSDQNIDLVLLKYSPDGQLAWTKQFNGGENRNDIPVGMALNEGGEVFITARSYVYVVGDHKTLTAKFSSSGDLAWIKSFTGPGTYSEPQPHSITLDAAGNPVVSGSSYISGQGYKLFVLKYNQQDGQHIWVKYLNEMDAAPNGIYSADILLTDAADNIYLAGARASGDLTGSRLLLLKLDAQGNMLWSKLDKTPSYDTYMTDAELDEQGNLVILGSSQFGRQSTEVYLAKYSPAGEKLWGNIIVDAAGKTLYPNALSVHNGGKIAFTGYVRGNYYEQIANITFLYTEDGLQVGTDRYMSEGGNAFGQDLVFDESGNLYIAGNAYQPNARHFFLVKYGINNTTPEEPCNIPVDVKLYLPPMAKRVGWQVRTTADFGSYTLKEDTGVRWTWGDGSEPTISYTAFGTPRITGEHTYQKAGIYPIGLNFDESCLKPNAEGYTQQMVIYDPEAGCVTGNGELQAPAILGNKKLTYAFSVRYPNKHAEQPVGNLHVQLGSMGNMVSRTLDWLVIDGSRAAVQGTAAISGKGNYKFVVTMLDAGGAGANDAGDGMRLQVWDMNAYGKLVFDSYPAGAGKLDLTQPLPSIGKGQIIINGSNAKLASQGSSKLESLETAGASAYPNPFAQKATVRFTATAAGAYEAVLYDAKGAAVGTLKNGTAQAAEAIEVEVDGSNLKNGLYFVKLSEGGQVQSVKLILHR